MKSHEKKYTLPQILAWLEGCLFVAGSRNSDHPAERYTLFHGWVGAAHSVGLDPYR